MDLANLNRAQDVEAVFKQGKGEHWKQHRSRVRALFEEIPKDKVNDKDFFKAVISSVAAWTLEYAGSQVRSDPDIIKLAIEADRTHGYAASALEYADATLKEDYEFVRYTLNIQPGEWWNLSDKMRSNKELALICAAGGKFPNEFAQDLDVLRSFVQSIEEHPFNYIPKMFHENLELAEAFINNGGHFLSLPTNLHDNEHLFLMFLETGNKIDAYTFERHLESANLVDKRLTKEFVAACLNVDLSFLKVIKFEQLDLDDWLYIFDTYNLVMLPTPHLHVNLVKSLIAQQPEHILIYPLVKIWIKIILRIKPTQQVDRVDLSEIEADLKALRSEFEKVLNSANKPS